MNESAFPDQFHWGAATSAYQIEGAVHEDGRGESVWDRFVQTRGVIAGGGTGEVACDHYHRFIDDIAIMSQIGLNAYRLSLSWPRILPDGWGRVNNTGLDFYDKLIDELLAKGIQPCPTLFHWDLPSRLEDSGGWLTRDAPKAFEEYADLVTRKLGDRVKRWTTINEPWTLAVKGYGQGVHAPGHRNWGEVPVVGHHLLLAHGLAIRAIRGNVDLAIGGIGLPLAPVFAASDHERDLEAALREDGWRNRFWLDPLHGKGYPADIMEIFGDEAFAIEGGDLDLIADSVDFLGVNYYGPVYVLDDPTAPPIQVRWVTNPELPQSAAGRPVQPAALTDLLVRIKGDYDDPILTITENGAAYDDPHVQDGQIRDSERTSFLHQHLAAVHSAIGEGVTVDGYFVGSLMDNFAWADGFTRRSGIVHVDFDTQIRTIKQSGRWYSRVIERNALVDPF